LELPKFFDVSLPACHGLRTPADRQHPCPGGCCRVAFGHVKTLGIRNKLISKLYQHFRVRGYPYGLQDSLSTLRLSCSPATIANSATDARLDTGGWLALTRQGLSPCKTRQAYLGAITIQNKRRVSGDVVSVRFGRDPFGKHCCINRPPSFWG
jgi:hypothetical protein